MIMSIKMAVVVAHPLRRGYFLNFQMPTSQKLQSITLHRALITLQKYYFTFLSFRILVSIYFIVQDY